MNEEREFIDFCEEMNALSREASAMMAALDTFCSKCGHRIGEHLLDGTCPEN